MSIKKVTKANFEDVLALIAGYQEFYQVGNIDEAKNRSFFSQFLDKEARGVLHIYYMDDKPIGFSTIYAGYSSTRAEEVAILNDLFVVSDYRGKGVGKALILHAKDYAKSKGYTRLQWLTTQDNETAQKVYDGLDTKKSAWYFYAMDIGI